MSTLGLDSSKQEDLTMAQDDKTNAVNAAPAGTTYLGLGAVAAIAIFVTGSILGRPLWGALGFIAVAATLAVAAVLGSRRQAPLDEISVRRRRRSIAMAWGLVIVMAMFYAATFVNFGGK